MNVWEGEHIGFPEKTLPFLMKNGALIALALLGGYPAFGQVTVIYQGQLTANGALANGSYDLPFAVYDSTNVLGNHHRRAAYQLSGSLNP
jgi:hypothetical protein